MRESLLLGNEAVAQAAINAGISGVYAYPGTPSTEITEYIQMSRQARQNKVRSKWSVNEKTAYETALGMSYAGKRSLVCMKQVGLNVAADPFMNSAITGVNGGLVLAVADDPGMHSSQNEQDSRFYGKFAMIPVLEPANQQEAYDMTYEAFQLSEQTQLPVMLRLTTRLSHSRSRVTWKKEHAQNELRMPTDKSQFLLLPLFARKSYQKLLEKQLLIQELAEQSRYNFEVEGSDHSLGIVCCGLGWNYFREVLAQKPLLHPVVKISHYPVPIEKLAALEEKCDALLVIEEGYPLVEEQLRDLLGNGKDVYGKLDGTLPRSGELTTDAVGKALGVVYDHPYDIPDCVVPRPPGFCKGCGHVIVFEALKEIMQDYETGHIFSDIGCYALAALPPLENIYSCVDMGASITMAKGAADAGLYPAIAVLGDSTFLHSGMTGFMDVIEDQSNLLIVISDNQSVAMTGGQNAPDAAILETICVGIGVDTRHLHVFTPDGTNQEDLAQLMRDEILFDGPSVIISRKECIQHAIRRVRRIRKHKKHNDEN